MNKNTFLFICVVLVSMLIQACKQQPISDKNILRINSPGKASFSVYFNNDIDFVCPNIIPKKVSLSNITILSEYSQNCSASNAQSMSIYCATVDWQNSQQLFDSSPFLATFDNIDNWNQQHFYASDFIPKSDSLYYIQYLILNFRDKDTFILALEDKAPANPTAMQELYSRGIFFRKSEIKDITLY